MSARRKLLAMSVALCVSSLASSAQDFVKSQRQFLKQGIYRISPGSLYERLQWPRPPSEVGRPRPVERSQGEVVKSVPARSAESLVPVAEDTRRAKSSAAPVPAPPSTKGAKAKVSPKKSPVRLQSPSTTWLWRTAGVVAVTMVLLLALMRLLRRRRAAREIEQLEPAPHRGKPFESPPSPGPEAEVQAPESLADLSAPGMTHDLETVAPPPVIAPAALARHVARRGAPEDKRTLPCPRASVDLAPTRNTEPDSDDAARAPSGGEQEIAQIGAVRLVWITSGNLRNNHIYVPLEFFPADSIGGADGTLTAPKAVSVTFHPGVTVVTDIDGARKILRDRDGVRDFFVRGDVREGDFVHITRTGAYSYEVRKVAAPGVDLSTAGRAAPPQPIVEKPIVGAVARDGHPEAPDQQEEVSPPLAQALTVPALALVAENDTALAPVDHADVHAIPTPDGAVGPIEFDAEAEARSSLPHRDGDDRGAPDDSGSAPEPTGAVPAPVEATVSDFEAKRLPETEAPVPAPDGTLPVAAVLVPAVGDEARARETAPDARKDSQAPEIDAAQARPAERPPWSAPAPKSIEDRVAAGQFPVAPSPEADASNYVGEEAPVTAAPAADKLPLAEPTATPVEGLLQNGGETLVVSKPPAKPLPLRAPDAVAFAALRHKWKDELFGAILSRVGIDGPDGRPLYAYPVEEDELAAIKAFVSRRIRLAEAFESTGAAFVFWAAEHIRAHYPRAGERRLAWAFLFEAFGLAEDKPFGRRLVSQGFNWWRRGVRQAENGNNLYLYSLLFEGGLPEALLQEGLYRRVILGLMSDIEKEGGARAAPAVVASIAQRRLMALPQTFQSDDFVRLLAEFGQALARLRAAAPVDLPAENIESWLSSHQSDWAQTLPLRASAETVKRLILPALQIEREPAPIGGPLVTRQLRRDPDGGWHGQISFAEQFWLPAAFLAEGQGLRLRLIPGGALVKGAGAPLLFAAPERNGWRAQLSGRSGAATARLPLSAPVVFSAFADGRCVGDIELDSGLPEPAEAVTLWRPAESTGGFSSDALTLSPTGRTRAPCLWALAPPGVRPVSETGLRVEGPEPAADGALWRVTGKGALSFGETRLLIETASDTEGPEARLVAIGATLAGWKIARRGGLVFLGDPTLYGQRDGQDLTALSDRSLTMDKSGRTFAQQTAGWVENGATLCRLRYVSLPPKTVISMRETAGGAARLTIEGLGAGRLLATASARDVRTQAMLVGGACEMTLTTAGAAPGEVTLRLSDPATGVALELVAPWPARSGMLLDGKGARLDRPGAVAAETLVEWRAIVPPDMSGDLHVSLQGAQEIILPAAGETPLGAHLTLIRALLAQDGPDARVNISLVVGGFESPRLEVRRYADGAVIQNGVLRVGLDRDAPAPPETALADFLETPRAIGLHVTDLREATARRLEATAPCDLRALLGESGGPWLIQARLDGRPQRAVFFSPRPSSGTRRDDRIASYADKWRALTLEPRNPEWTRLWKVLEALTEGGDAGCADEAQALAQAPEALVMLALRVRRNALGMALGLDLAAPIFWPALPVTAFVTAVRRDYTRRRDAFIQIVGEAEAENDAATELVARIGDILALRPELAAHFGRALIDAGLISHAFNEQASPGLRESLAPKSLDDLGMKAARRFDKLPHGLRGVAPRRRPPGRVFDTDTQAVIDAPIVTAEIAAGQRVATPKETLMLIGLRLIDPEYFDRAVPAALAFYLETIGCVAPA
jgi:hypothetical protein